MSLYFFSLHFCCHGLNLLAKLSFIGTTKEFILILTLPVSCKIPQILYKNYISLNMHSLLPTNCDPRKSQTRDKLRVQMDITATHPQSLNKKKKKLKLWSLLDSIQHSCPKVGFSKRLQIVCSFFTINMTSQPHNVNCQCLCKRLKSNQIITFESTFSVSSNHIIFLSIFCCAENEKLGIILGS